MASLGEQMGRPRVPGISAPSEILAAKPTFGSVTKGRDGYIQVAVGEVVLRLAKADYWTLMEMLSDAARRLAAPRAFSTLRPTCDSPSSGGVE